LLGLSVGAVAAALAVNCKLVGQHKRRVHQGEDVKRVDVESELKRLNLQLPPALPAGGVYTRVRRSGRLLFVSGHGPQLASGGFMKGKVGKDYDVKEGYEAGRLTALSILSTIKAELGSLDGIKCVVKTLGLVNCTPEFEETPSVINGCSDVFVQIWGGTNGKGTRSAIGTNALPFQFPVEVEMIFELHCEPKEGCGRRGKDGCC